MKYEVVVPGVGPTPCDLMIVGEAGGRSEVEQGAPFVGRSGLLLDDALHKAGGIWPLAIYNLLLFLFNIIPIKPTDGWMIFKGYKELSEL